MAFSSHSKECAGVRAPSSATRQKSARVAFFGFRVPWPPTLHYEGNAYPPGPSIDGYDTLPPMKHQNGAQKGLSFAVLGSGNSGNCAVVRSDRTCLLLDAGLSARKTSLGLESLGLTLEDIDIILLTHEHGDHAQGLPSICCVCAVPVFCNSLTQVPQFAVHEINSS